MCVAVSPILEQMSYGTLILRFVSLCFISRCPISSSLHLVIWTNLQAARKLFETKIADKHQETMCKFGAIIAQGIIDAGERNGRNERAEGGLWTE